MNFPTYISIKSENDVRENQKFLADFETLYLNAFPDNEREPYENIIGRIENGSLPLTSIKLSIIDSKCVGGIIMDCYPECAAIEATYMVVDECFRGNGIGKTLLQGCLNEWSGIEHLFFECDNPETVAPEDSAIDPTQRLNMWLRWGYEILPFKYVQPPLSREKDYERNLLLLHKGTRKLTKTELKKFLRYFYKYLGYSKSSELSLMYEDVEKNF